MVAVTFVPVNWAGLLVKLITVALAKLSLGGVLGFPFVTAVGREIHVLLDLAANRGEVAQLQLLVQQSHVPNGVLHQLLILHIDDALRRRS